MADSSLFFREKAFPALLYIEINGKKATKFCTTEVCLLQKKIVLA
jgi:hypothetical protein